MDIFHYVANELANTPLFESPLLELEGENRGAVFNDFEYITADFEEKATSSQYSGPSNADIFPSQDVCTFVPQPLVDHAILEADSRDGGIYCQSIIDSFYFDIETIITEASYLQKVFQVTTQEFDNVNINKETVEIYKARRRNNYEQPDTFYDAWLLRQETPRDAFPLEDFKRLFPHWNESEVEEVDVKPSFITPEPKRFKQTVHIDKIIILSDSE
jgi:hypothetical protein